MIRLCITMVATTIFLAGCLGGNETVKTSSEARSGTCIITAPSTGSGDQGALIDTAADLSAFGKLPIKANFKVELKNKFEQTRQKVSDSNARCQMLTQLAACYKDAPDARLTVINLISTSNACGG